MIDEPTGSAVPELFMAYLAASKSENNSNYKIDDIDVREFTGECWKLLSPEERKHYREQLEAPEKVLSDPSIKKLAFDLNRGLQSAYNEASKNKSDINDELDAQVTNFKYVNLSNSDLHKDKNLGFFANEPLQNRDSFKDQPLLAISMETALSTFPPAKRLGYIEEDKTNFIDATAAILEGVTNSQNGSILKNGALDATLTASVAAYVDKNFKDLQDLSKEEQAKIGEAFKEEYKKLHAEQEQTNKKDKRPKGYPVEISSTKFADAFERVTVEKRLLNSEDQFIEVEVDTPPPPKTPPRSASTVMDFMRKMVSSDTTAPVRPSATVKSTGSQSTGRPRQ